MNEAICVCNHVLNGHTGDGCGECDCEAFFPRSEPTMTISLSRKINTGNYESAEVFVSVSGVRAGMTPEDLAPLLDTGKIAYDELRARLAEQIRETIAAIEEHRL